MKTNLGNLFSTSVRSFAENLLIGEFQFEVLLAVAALGKDAYGSKICRYLERKQERDINIPQIYAALTRMTNLELVTSEIDESGSAGKRGRPRRVYKPTASGLRILKTRNDLRPMLSKDANVPASTNAPSSSAP